MRAPGRQRGVALFTAVFLIVAVGLVGLSVALMSGQQQLSSAQTLDQTRAYYAARGRLDVEIANLLGGAACGSGPATQQTTFGFTTQIDTCTSTTVNEGGSPYAIFDLSVAAWRGDLAAGTLVRRTVRARVTSGP